MQIRVNAPKNTISSRSNIRSPKFFFFFSFILGSSPYIIDSPRITLESPLIAANRVTLTRLFSMLIAVASE